MKPKKSINYLSSLPDINGKKVIITGANSGLGYAAADLLIAKGAHVVLACRNMERATKALNSLKEKYPESNIEIMMFDQGSLLKLDEAKNDLIKNHSDFYALILNAGILYPPQDAAYAEGVPMTAGTNYIGVLYFLNIIQDYLNTVKEEKRIIVQGSASAGFYRYKSKEKCLTDFDLSLFKQYAYSKLGTTNALIHFGKNNTNSNVVYALAEPGAVSTNIFNHASKFLKFWAPVFTKMINFKVEEGALSLVTHACVSKLKNLEYCTPNQVFHLRGLPKHRKIPRKWYSPKMINDGFEIINEIKKLA